LASKIGSCFLIGTPIFDFGHFDLLIFNQVKVILLGTLICNKDFPINDNTEPASISVSSDVACSPTVYIVEDKMRACEDDVFIEP
jgi:hypothetical protein